MEKYNTVIERDVAIHKLYKLGYTIEELMEEFDMPKAKILWSIKHYNKLTAHRKKLLDEIHEYLTPICPLHVVTRIYNSIYIYLYVNELFYKDDIRKIVYNDKIYVRGIGKKSRELLKGYFGKK